MPWLGELWMVSYLAHKSRSGSGTGLYIIDSQLRRRKHPESVDGTYANRYVHYPTSHLIIGPHVVDDAGNVRTVHELVDVRLTATCTHLNDPENKVYMLGMAGEFFELDVHTLETRQLGDLRTELGLPEGCKPHFKGACTAHKRLVVSNNTCDARDWTGEWAAGRLAEFDGETWRILEKKPFYEACGRRLGGTLFAAGWDNASAILKMYADGQWTTWRLPKASANYEHFWQHEWPRMREVEHERILADIHGMFYEISPHHWAGRPFPIRPISTHLPAYSDFAIYRGLLFMGTNQMTPFEGDNNLVGEADSGLWAGKSDDLWSWGRPAGWGGPWLQTKTQAGEPSDPYLMTGFLHKGLHLAHDGDGTVTFTVELDVAGNGQWTRYHRFEAGSGDAVHHAFPTGIGAHWLRVTAERDCTATCQLHYL